MSDISRGFIAVLDPSDDVVERGKYNQASADSFYNQGNFPKSFAINMISAKEGYAPCQYNVGWAYNKGEGVALDLEEAARWYKKAAEQGLAHAQHALAQLAYHNNVGDSNEALKHLVKSSDAGFPPSQHLLAVVLDGNGKHAQAFALYKKAAEAGYVNSQRDLAICYLNGEGTAQSLEKAKYWLSVAAKHGSVKAADLLNRL